MSTTDTIDTIRQLHRERQDFHRAEKSLTLQIRACCRNYCDPGRDVEWGDRLKAMKKAGDVLYKALEDNTAHPLFVPAWAHLKPFFLARETLNFERTKIEKRLEKLAKELPVAPMISAIKGIAMGGLAALIGEAGNLSNYETVSRLWKRMGVAVIGDGRQRKVEGAAAALHGYSPRRRSVLWNIGCGLIGCMGHGPRPLVGEDVSARDDLSDYQKLFIERCREEVKAHPEMGRDPVIKDGIAKESYSAHASNRAKRYVEKRFLIDIWRAWRACEMEIQKAA